MIRPVIVPQMNVNDETVLLAKWYVKEGDFIKVSDPLCLAETSKAAVDINADSSGYVRKLLYRAGDTARVTQPLCLLADSMDEELKGVEALPKKNSQTETQAHDERITLKAKAKAKELGVDISKIDKVGVIRETDVTLYHAKTQKKAVTGGNKGQTKSENISKDFFARLTTDQSFAGLSSEEKLTLYRQNGAEIGNQVVLGDGVVIVAKNIVLGNGVTIGRKTYIEADSVQIGSLVKIGKECELVSGLIEIGDVTTLADRVVFDLSGGKEAASAVITGKECLIGMEAYLNSSRTIELGDHVAISPRAMIYTHSFWQSVLQGYHAAFEGVTFESDSWVGSAAQVFPGVRVGKGSIVMSNSFVVQNVAPFTMVAGVPAVVLKDQLAKDLSRDEKEEILLSLLEEFAGHLAEKGCKVEAGAEAGDYKIQARSENLMFRLKLIRDAFKANEIVERAVFVGLDCRGVDVKPTQAVFDLESGDFRGETSLLSDELRDFLRRRGIRFRPIEWRYNYRKGM